MGGLEFVVIAFFFGLSAAIIGKIKGSSFWLWLLIGTVLPGIGTLGAILYRWERQELRRRCEECGKVFVLANPLPRNKRPRCFKHRAG